MTDATSLHSRAVDLLTAAKAPTSPAIIDNLIGALALHPDAQVISNSVDANKIGVMIGYAECRWWYATWDRPAKRVLSPLQRMQKAADRAPLDDPMRGVYERTAQRMTQKENK